MSIWIDIGYKWKTEAVYRVREILKEYRIPFRMPFDEMFFKSMYCLPHRDWTWGIKVRRKDLARVLAILAKEGLIHSPVQQPREMPKRKPISFRQQRIRPFPAIQKKRWAVSRPGTGNM